MHRKKPAGWAQVAQAKRSREPTNQTAKTAGRRLSDGGGNAGRNAKSLLIDGDTRPTKLSKVTYPDRAEAKQAPRPPPYPLPPAFPFLAVPRKSRSSNRARRSSVYVGWMALPSSFHPEPGAMDQQQAPGQPPALNGKPGSGGPTGGGQANKKLKLSLVGAAAKPSKVKMLDGLASTQALGMHSARVASHSAAARKPAPAAQSPQQPQQQQQQQQQEEQGAWQDAGLQRSASMSPPGSSPRPKAQQVRPGGPMLRGAALRSSLAKQARDQQHPSAEQPLHAADMGDGLMDMGAGPQSGAGQAAGLMATGRAASGGAQAGAAGGDPQNSYLDAQRRMRAELAQRLSQRAPAQVPGHSSGAQGTAAGYTQSPYQAQQHQQQQQHFNLLRAAQVHAQVAQQQQQQQHHALAAGWPHGLRGAPLQAALPPHPATLARAHSAGTGAGAGVHPAASSPPAAAASMMMPTPGLPMQRAPSLGGLAYPMMPAAMPMIPVAPTAYPGAAYLNGMMPFMPGWPTPATQDMLSK